MNIFKTFRIRILLRILLICLSFLIFFFLVQNTKLYATFLIVGTVVIYQIYSLFRFVEKSNRDLSRFFEALRHADFSQSFSGAHLGPSFKELNQALTGIIKDFQRYRTEKEEHHRYLQTVVQHVGMGLIVFRSDGTVDLTNTAAKRLLNFSSLKNITSLKDFSPQLVETLFRLNPGEKSLLKIENSIDYPHLTLYATGFRMRGEQFKLVSLYNIRSELEETEMEAWQKMIRILTHEIMNSITPISSLASTLTEMINTSQSSLSQTSESNLDGESLDDIKSALKTIHKRSKGLLNFVGAYRNLTLIPKPQFKIFSIQELFSRIEKLLEPRFKEEGILFDSMVEPQSLELTADPELIEQVILNLLLNSIDGVKDSKKPKIILTAGMGDRGHTWIKVQDNGSGILQEALGKIFIPFFSTKKKGSGIGLSLARQIMRLHKGSIAAESVPKSETTFTMTF